MADDPIAPEACESMSDVRAGIDDLDARIIALLAKRFGFMRAAARVKQERGLVRDESRKAEVIENARRHAAALNVPEDLVAELWDRLVEGSIEYEFNAWDRQRKDS